MHLTKRGQSLVEFALILPVLILVFFAIIDGAFIVQGLLTVNHAAREAARFAVTYQPVQGECLEHIEGGMVDNSYPWCPTNVNESDADYYERRVDIIKQFAVDNARGLRISEYCLDDTCLAQDKSGVYGVRVWGFQAYEGQLEQDRPGLPGLPVRVQVVHKVPLVIFSTLLPDPYVQVDGAVEMVNEGVQAGLGNQPPPVGGTIPPISGPEDPPETVETPDPGETPEVTVTGTPEAGRLTLNFETATNMLPGEREHLVEAHVTQAGVNLVGQPVRFTINNGSFDPSGNETMQSDVVNTDGDGKARVYIYANEPMVATVEAWADINLNGVKETLEVDTATKTWKTTGPYLIVSNHYPEAGDVIGAQMQEHNPGLNPYELWWCPSSVDAVTTAQIEEKLAAGLSVDAGGFYEATGLDVPAGAFGIYHLESHTGSGACGESGTLVAQSADIEIKEVPPDLTITKVEILSPEESQRAPGLMMTLTVEVQNLQPVPVTTGPFDVDVYPHLDQAPYPMQLSAEKQWVETMEPGETMVMSFTVEIVEIGLNRLWVQVDTTDYVMESDEENNLFGPLEFETCAGSDDFDNGLKSVWTVSEIGDADGQHWINDLGELVINNASSSGLWSGSHNFYYIYQAIPDGDVFDARLRLIQKPDENTWSKIGLHVREDSSSRAEYVMNMITNNQSPAGVQIAHNATRPVDDRATSLPYWARIVREGNTYKFYGADVADPQEGDWIPSGTATENTPLPLIGVAHANYDNYPASIGIVDDFVICPVVVEGGGAAETAKPPGLVECEELIQIPGFEGNRDTVFEYWRARDALQTSQAQYRGNFSMRLAASLGSYPCTQNSLDPYLYQDIQIPTTVYSISTLIVTGHYLVDGSDLECSNPGHPDPIDKLTLELQSTDDTVLVPAKDIATGATVSQTWTTIPVTLSESIELDDYAGQKLRLYWDAYHNDNFDGTFFYIDDVSAQLCTMWPVPDEVEGTVSLGGTLTTKAASSSIRVPLPGADVWAYTQAGETYHTVSIHDGSYHFYNLTQPGTYVVYAEAMVDGQLRTAVADVDLDPNERNYSVNLLLQ